MRGIGVTEQRLIGCAMRGECYDLCNWGMRGGAWGWGGWGGVMVVCFVC